MTTMENARSIPDMLRQSADAENPSDFNSLFDTLFHLNDKSDTTDISVLVHKFSRFKVGEKTYFVCTFVERFDHLVKAFAEKHVGSELDLEFFAYNRQGETIDRDIWTVKFLGFDDAIFDGNNSAKSPVYVNLLFVDEGQ